MRIYGFFKTDFVKRIYADPYLLQIKIPFKISLNQKIEVIHLMHLR